MIRKLYVAVVAWDEFDKPVKVMTPLHTLPPGAPASHAVEIMHRGITAIVCEMVASGTLDQATLVPKPVPGVPCPVTAAPDVAPPDCGRSNP